MVTFPNGLIPTSAMTALSVGGFLLPAAAQNFEQWRAVARNAGWNLTITSAADAFRTYVIQERIFRARYTLTPLWQRPTKRWNGQTWYLLPGQATAAVPGTSNHGKGLAVDIKDAGGFKGKFYEWMTETGPAFGWSNAEGRSINEPWHWVNDNKPRGAIGSIPDVVPPAIPEKDVDDMPTPMDLLNAAHPEFGGRTLAQQLRQIIDNDAANRTHIQGVVEGSARAVVEAVLNTPIPRAGTGTGTTTLAAVLAYYDSHVAQILDTSEVNVPTSIDIEAVTQAIVDKISEKKFSLTD